MYKISTPEIVDLQPASNPTGHRKHVIRATAHATDVM